ncbi:hypothetical protein AL755_09750 [Arthrobacter sp. ERGS1:01]|nr:hypothetical protein AL755_09750 [Arthrobacter sp. ERGS1:01]
MVRAVVTGPGLRAEVQPDRGARIVSLRGDDGHEWLVPSTRTAAPGRDQRFVRPGMGGWDEVAPTVQADPGFRIAAGGGPGAGPDHGDVWNVPWSVHEATPASLTTSVHLHSLPVVVERTIAASATGLTLSYRAVTESPEPVPLLWCAHPQFAAPAGTAVSLEAGGESIAPALCEMYPHAGRERPFPTAPLHARLAPDTSLKAFVDPGVRADAAVLAVGGGRTLRIGWNPDQLPFLGLFWDNGEFAAQPVIAVEPSTAWGERLSTAAQEGRVLTLSRGRPLDWVLALSAGSGGGTRPGSC